jgi:glycosyltransferase involved in cell wall biosynthesis
LKKFSIVTVVKNNAEGLKETIESVINQVYKDYEYLIICGESDEDTYDVIERYKKHITKYIIEKDKGIYFAMNKALDFCQGEYINFLNAGDSFTSKHVLDQVVNELDHDTEIICGSIKSIDDSGKKTFKSWKEKFHPKHNMFWYHQTMFVKKKLFDKSIFDTNFKVSADYDWSLKQYLSGVNYKFIDRAIVDFKEGGYSERNKIKARIEDLFIQSKYFHCDESILESNSFNKLKIYSKNNNFILPKLLERLDAEIESFENKFEKKSVFGLGTVARYILDKYKIGFEKIYDHKFFEINNNNIIKRKVSDPNSISNKTNEYIIITALGYEHEIESFLIKRGLNKKLIIKFEV